MPANLETRDDVLRALNAHACADVGDSGCLPYQLLFTSDGLPYLSNGKTRIDGYEAVEKNLMRRFAMRLNAKRHVVACEQEELREMERILACASEMSPQKRGEESK